MGKPKYIDKLCDDLSLKYDSDRFFYEILKDLEEAPCKREKKVRKEIDLLKEEKFKIPGKCRDIEICPKEPEILNCKGSLSLIPYASGGTVALDVIQPSSTNANVGIIAFGNNVTTATDIPSRTITVPIGGTTNMAYTASNFIKIRSITADFTLVDAEQITSGSIVIKAQLYRSFPPSNIFSAIPGTEITLGPALTGVVPSGSILVGIKRNIHAAEICPQSRIILVFSAVAQGTGATIATSPINGYASAGVTIELK